MMSATSSRVVRSLAHRNASLDWAKPIFRSDHEMTAKINQFRAWLASADAMAEKYKAPPSPIDFSSVKSSVRGKDLVENLEKFYASASPPAETYVWSEEDKAEKATLIEEAKVDRKKVLEDINYYQSRLATIKANRTTRDVTAAQFREVYPDIAKEIDEEIENREWFKDVVDSCKSAPNDAKYRNMLKERYPDQVDEIDKHFDMAFPPK